MPDERFPEHEEPDHAPRSATSGVSEGDVEAALTNAAEKAEELAREVGPEEISTRGFAEPESDGSSASLLDRQLGQIDSLLNEAESQVGTADPNDTRAPQTNEAHQPAPAAYAVPDFMAEFTKPEVPPIAPPPTPRPVEEVTPEHAKKQEIAEETSTPPVQATSSRSPSLPTSSLRKKNWAEAMLRCLEAIDRPFSWIGDGPKRIIGWLALVFLATALVVTVFSSL